MKKFFLYMVFGALLALATAMSSVAFAEELKTGGVPVSAQPPAPTGECLKYSEHPPVWKCELRVNSSEPNVEFTRPFPLNESGLRTAREALERAKKAAGR